MGVDPAFHEVIGQARERVVSVRTVEADAGDVTAGRRLEVVDHLERGTRGQRVGGVQELAVRRARDAADRGDAGIAAIEAYDRLRISLGVPGGSDDLEVERSILLENGFEELGGVSFEKGCFVGQELTARTKYRALIKKRLVPVRFEGPPPLPGTTVKAGEAEAGVMRSTAGDMGLALLRLDRLNAGALIAGKAELHPELPDWLQL